MKIQRMIWSISSHRDGDCIADPLQLQNIRGASTRGGSRALIEMIRKCRDERAGIGISPDALNGPRERGMPGIVLLARKTAVKIYRVSRAICRSWHIRLFRDHFYIPKPLLIHGFFVLGEPLFIALDACDRASLDRVQSAMDSACKIADSYFI